MGDRDEIFENLYVRFYKAVFFFFLERGYSEDRSADLTQETFVRVYRGMATYRQDAARSWILTIALNVWRNALRASNTEMRGAKTSSLETLREEQGFDPPSAPGSPPAPYANAYQRELRLRLRAAILRLPNRMRQCFQLRLRDCSYLQIVGVMKVSIDTVKSLLYQAKQRLADDPELSEFRENLSGFFSKLDLPQDGGDP